ncbi:hepatitis A virus cellular receptor 1 homolog [Plectropomus leopardus]|uniref:hepatitis A virus cellular receptor 1 homolog n=1 Tax=Plectropomus leopardus TaxID=160734 RepID=UPI001C4D41AF|nr:hepatitis A virus cellular receptor 1 homolog [Plectropomus leopardus]
MRFALLLALLTGCVCVSAVGVGDGSTVVGRRGEDVTLSCKYDIKYNGPLHVCWGRGQIPNSGCSEQLLYADGYKVTKGSRASRRYQLLGRLDEGDVSLTILNVSEQDAGRYGCRVMIKGILNDLKYHLDLVVEEAPQTSTATTSHRETSTEHTTNHTTGHMTSTDRLLTSSSSSITAEVRQTHFLCANSNVVD